MIEIVVGDRLPDLPFVIVTARAATSISPGSASSGTDHGVATVVTPLCWPIETAAHGLRPLILVGASGALVSVLRNHAEIVRADSDRESPKPPARSFPVRFHSLGRCCHGGSPSAGGWCTQTRSQGVNNPRGPMARPAAAAQGWLPLRLFGRGHPPRHPCGGRLGSVSRQTVYRVQSPVQVHAENSAGRGRAMRDIADWLTRLGLPEYAGPFAENGIDVSVLPHLTDQDLKDIGVLLGHRRKMLASIAQLAGAAPATPEPAPRSEPKTQDTAERRQVTVMFSDLVGSTALSAGIDPEDLREIISAYQKCVADTVQRFGGFVAKYMGDGVLVYFGYPQAHEDDAERAVRAARDVHRGHVVPESRFDFCSP